MSKIKFEDLILHENEDYYIVNKPPFISSLDERNGEAISILRMAKKYFPESQLCHRLDKETSGILLIAKNPASYRHFSMLFEHRKMVKNYIAIVEGVHNFDMQEVYLPIGKGKEALMRVDFKEGKDALTFFNTEKFYKHFTLVRCTPITGRTHQIRVHLSSQNAVIAGDIAYGGSMPMLSKLKRKYIESTKDEDERPIIQRFALHARTLKFVDIEGVEKEFTADYPKDMAVFIKILEKFDAGQN